MRIDGFNRFFRASPAVPGFLLAYTLLLAACSAQASPSAVSPTAAQQVLVSSPTLAPSPTATVQLPVDTATSPTSSPAPEATQPASDQPISSMPDCTSPAALTPPLTEGPYFTAGSPERSSLLEPGLTGTQLTLTGYVLTVDCQPVAHALLDFWQANAQGQYDNSGYTLRGHQFTDESGRYQLVTVVPGLYPGRTEHIHFKVQSPGGPILTSQLFFPDVAGNQSDRIFDPALVINITQESSAGLQATYNFIIQP